MRPPAERGPDGPWPLGHFPDNQRPFGPDSLKDYLALPASDTGHRAAVEFLLPAVSLLAVAGLAWFLLQWDPEPAAAALAACSSELFMATAIALASLVALSRWAWIRLLGEPRPPASEPGTRERGAAP